MFNSFKSLAPSVFLFHELRSLARMRTIISVFIFHFCSVRVCLFVLNNVFTIKDTKLLTGRGLRDATDVVHPCKKQQVKPWRPMLYWTGVEEYVYPLNVNLCCFELFTSGSMTARNILPWLWLIFEDNFVLLGQVLVGVHSWNRSWRIFQLHHKLLSYRKWLPWRSLTVQVSCFVDQTNGCHVLRCEAMWKFATRVVGSPTLLVSKAV